MNKLLVVFAVILTTCNLLGIHGAGNNAGDDDDDQGFTETELIKAADMGVSLVEKLERHESAIANSPIKVHNGSVSHGLLLENYPTTFSIQQNYFAKMILKGTEYLMNNNCKVNGVKAKECVIDAEIPETTSLWRFCEMGARSQRHAKRGVHMYRRMVPNNYKDGLHKFPGSTAGGELPNPRKIAEKLFKASDDEEKDHSRSIAVAQWAQFIEQDLARTVQSTMRDGTPIECCNRFNRVAAPRSSHPSCQPIKVSTSDSFYGKIDVSCLNYVRSALAVNPSCKFGPAEQLNQASNKLDLSQLYGITEEEKQRIRKFSNGKLKSQFNASVEQLPFSNEHCIDEPCFASGDPRVNSNPYSYALHTIFLRFHNHLARELAHHHLSWSDEELFEGARRLNIHVYQRIIYEEWAPVVLGHESANNLLRSTETSAPEHGTVSNEFATAAIRFYNTMFPGDLMLAQKLENPLDPFAEQLFALQDVQYKPKKLRLDKIMSAVTRYHAMALDTSYVDDLSNQLYRATQQQQSETLAFGSDSLALDIQRSRDHGLGGYTAYVKKCTGRDVQSWNDLGDLINAEDLETFRQLYKTHKDVDLIVGALAEVPQKDATVGPTLQCIIADQLLNSKINDPNFYSLHTTQVERHMKQLSARLLCETTRVSHVQGNIFLVPSTENSLEKCVDLEQLEQKITSSRKV